MQLDFHTSKVQELYNYLETSIFDIVCGHLKKQIGLAEGLDIQEWQVQALADTGQLTNEVLKRIAEVSGIAPGLIREAVYASGFEAKDTVDDYLSHRTTPPDYGMNMKLDAYVRQAVMNLENLVNQSLISNNVAAQIYADIINNVTAEVITGISTVDNAVSKIVNQWLDKGIPSGFVDKGGRTWSIENYARTTVTTAANNAYNQLMEDRTKEYGLTTFVVGSHPAARPACSKIQGQIADYRPMSEIPPGWPYRSVYDPYWEADYKRPHGHRGINCSHPHFPHDPEFDENNMTQYDPEEARQADEIEAGRKAKANSIRKAKKKLAAFEALGDEAKTKYYKNLLAKQRADMVQYTQSHGLKRDYSMERVDPRLASV